MHLSKMLKNAQVGALGTKIYVCGGTDDSWTAHATVEVGFSTTVMMTSRVVMAMMIMRQVNYDDHNDHETEESEEHHCLILCVHAGSGHHHRSLANSS